jgi:cbb3-type cytochrome oxidase subunit 3
VGNSVLYCIEERGWTTMMGCYVWWELLRVYMFILPLNILIYACVYHAFKKKEKKSDLEERFLLALASE